MELTDEDCIGYSGLDRNDGLAHVRMYEGSGRRSVAIVGQLEDNPGTPVEQVIVQVFDAVKRLDYKHRGLDLITYSTVGETFKHVTFTVRVPGELTPAQEEAADAAIGLIWDIEYPDAELARERGSGHNVFRNPVWHPVEDLTTFIDADVKEWAPGDYTCASVFGPEGEARRIRQIRFNEGAKLGLYDEVKNVPPKNPEPPV